MLCESVQRIVMHIAVSLTHSCTTDDDAADGVGVGGGRDRSRASTNSVWECVHANVLGHEFAYVCTSMRICGNVCVCECVC